MIIKLFVNGIFKDLNEKAKNNRSLRLYPEERLRSRIQKEYINSKLGIEKIKPIMFAELEKAFVKRGISLQYRS